jgi:2-phosphoglycerate kinase
MYPKLILIGGAPNTGKTAVARVIASQLNYSCLSTDDLLKAITSVTTSTSHPSFHRMAGWTTQEYYVNHTVDELISHNMERLKTFRLAIEGVIKSHVAKEDSIVIEGFGLWPEYINNLNLPDIGMAWLVADETLLDKRTRKIKPFYNGASDEERMIKNYVGRSAWYNSKVIEATGKLNIPLVKVSDDFSVEALSVKLLNILELKG